MLAPRALLWHRAARSFPPIKPAERRPDHALGKHR